LILAPSLPTRTAGDPADMELNSAFEVRSLNDVRRTRQLPKRKAAFCGERGLARCVRCVEPIGMLGQTGVEQDRKVIR
jgi:hypothetical protein